MTDPYWVFPHSTSATLGVMNRIEPILILGGVTSDMGSWCADKAIRSLSGTSAVNKFEGGLL
jgi:hypothetical protein